MVASLLKLGWSPAYGTLPSWVDLSSCNWPILLAGQIRVLPLGWPSYWSYLKSSYWEGIPIGQISDPLAGMAFLLARSQILLLGWRCYWPGLRSSYWDGFSIGHISLYSSCTCTSTYIYISCVTRKFRVSVSTSE
jgi:hypothetical protein